MEWSEFEEYRRRNDEFVFLPTEPTVRPEIDVSAPPDLQFALMFDTREAGSDLHRISESRYQATSVLLPYQGIRLRWWHKDDQAKWGGDEKLPPMLVEPS